MDKKDKRYLIRTCASCEYTYWGYTDCPKCKFASYDATYVYGGWFGAIFEWVTNKSYKKRLKDAEVREDNRSKVIDRLTKTIQLSNKEYDLLWPAGFGVFISRGVKNENTKREILQ